MLKRGNCTLKRRSAYALLVFFPVIIHTILAFTPECLQTKRCQWLAFSRNTEDEDFGIDDDAENLNMKAFQLRKHKLMIQNRQHQWHQPPNPLLGDPVEFVQALLVSLQQRQKTVTWNGALCLLRSSTPAWRSILLKSIGAPPNATNEQVAPTLQNALERSNNQFAILTRELNEKSRDDKNLSSASSSIQECWHFPSDPVIFEADDDDDQNEREDGQRITHHCWIESRLRSPKDNQLLAVVGWSLQRRQIMEEQDGHDSSNFDSNASDFVSCWLLAGIDWQDFRDEFRPGIGREEWERICG
jgi:hypothetical protein